MVVRSVPSTVMFVLVYHTLHLRCKLFFESPTHAVRYNYGYDVSIWVFILAPLVLALGFACYGSFFVLRTCQLIDRGKLLTTMVFRVTMITIVFCVCFVVQAFMFLWRPITSHSVDPIPFTIFGYAVPLMIPVVVQLVLLRQKKLRGEAARRDSSVRGSQSQTTSALAAELLKYSSAEIKPEHIIEATSTADPSMKTSLLANE